MLLRLTTESQLRVCLRALADRNRPKFPLGEGILGYIEAPFLFLVAYFEPKIELSCLAHIRIKHHGRCQRQSEDIVELRAQIGKLRVEAQQVVFRLMYREIKNSFSLPLFPG